ncbi:BRO family protein [Shouchella rhizosphaerae]|uniref:BRO family protein n=1 Tax=Shouchella rhizosphaerae TaxID=866786 RepID=UPI003F8139E0
MNQLTKMFEGQEVRIVNHDGEPWFVAKDVCRVLDIKNHSDAVSRLRNSQKSVLGISDPHGRVQNTTVLNEAGVYKLVFRSNKPEAEKFSDWVAEEVLPSIRKTGSFSLQVPQTFSEALMLAANLQKKIEEDQPKVEAHDRFISGSNHQKMADVAKVLGFGRNTLFKMLREAKILMANNTPYQRYIDQGYFVVKETPVTMGGQTINRPQTYVTAKGVEWLSRQYGQNKKPLRTTAT